MSARRLLITLASLMAALLFTACGGATVGGSAGAPAAQAPAEPVFSEVNRGLEGGANEAPAAAPQSSTDSQAQQPASQRLVIKTAQVSLQVESVANAEAQVRARAEQLGGYVVSVQTSGSDAYMSSLITFRVPADRFDEALNGVEGLAKKVLSRSVGGEDVTEEFVDLGSRLRALEATRDRLLDLLAKATRVEDALQVNQALTDIQAQIEQIQGRMKYLTQSAAFSTITADLQPVPPPPTIYEEDGWQPMRVAGEALAGLVEFGQGLVNLAIVLLVWSPVWLPLLLLVRWAVLRAARAVRAAKPTAPPAPPAPQA